MDFIYAHAQKSERSDECCELGRLERLLNASDLGDMRPTHLLAKMQELANGVNINENLLKMLFIQRMPSQIRSILAISDGTLPKLAEMADKIMESPQAAAVTTQFDPQRPEEQIKQLKEQIEVLSAEFRRTKINRSGRRSRSSSSSRFEEEL